VDKDQRRPVRTAMSRHNSAALIDSGEIPTGTHRNGFHLRTQQRRLISVELRVPQPRGTLPSLNRAAKATETVGFRKDGGNRWGLAATDPTLSDRLDDLVFAG
jgi:hypothetical protein